MSRIMTKLNIAEIVSYGSTKVFRKLSAALPMPEAGLYDADDNLLADWNELVNTYGLDCTQTCTSSNYKTKTNSGYYVLTNYFAQMTGLKIVFGDVTSIGNYNFYNCDGLASVIISDSVTSIGSRAFNHCGNIAELTIGKNVQTISSYAFQYCNGLQEVIIPDSVTSIGNYAFSSCTGLTKAQVGNSVTTIGNNAFYGCVKLSDLTLGSAVTSLGDSVFGQNVKLVNLVIPASVTSIGLKAFYNTSALESVTMENPEGWWVSTSETATSGTAVDLSEPAQNAVNFNTTFINYYWKRS